MEKNDYDYHFHLHNRFLKNKHNKQSEWYSFCFSIKKKMKATTKLIAGISLIGIAGLIIYARRRYKTNQINRMKEYASRQVAEHGYETAHDILFPQKNKRSGKFGYRPV